MDEGEEQVKLLTQWPSPFAIRVLIGLAEKDVKYEYQEENFASKSELLLQMNPIHRKVPPSSTMVSLSASLSSFSNTSTRSGRALIHSCPQTHMTEPLQDSGQTF